MMRHQSGEEDSPTVITLHMGQGDFHMTKVCTLRKHIMGKINTNTKETLRLVMRHMKKEYIQKVVQLNKMETEIIPGWLRTEAKISSKILSGTETILRLLSKVVMAAIGLK